MLKNPAEVAELVGAWVERRRKRLPARLGRWFNRSDVDPVAERARAPRQPRLAQILRRVRRREQENAIQSEKMIQPATAPVVVATGPARSPYEGLPKTNYWRSGVAEVDPTTIQGLYVKKFAIERTTKVATAGSCFAQHIGRRLKQRGFDVLDFEPPPASLSAASTTKFGYNIYSARYGNIYLCRQLLQLAQEAFNRRSPAEVAWTKDGRFFDALRPGVEPEGFDTLEELVHHRRTHLQAVHKLLSEAELFIFTFGLTEGWISRVDGTAYPTAPGTIAGQFDPAKYQFKNFTYSEVLSDFLEFRELMRSVNPRIRFLLTVSPVPLTATASSNHVLVASTYSKAVLRGVAGELTERFQDVDYFPSFELIASHFSKGAFFDSNLRSVTDEGVDTVMRIFFAAHDPNGRVSALQNVEDDPKAKARERRQARRFNQKATRTEEEVCEEAMLEAFNR
jgi:hypothetical protein